MSVIMGYRYGCFQISFKSTNILAQCRSSVKSQWHFYYKCSFSLRLFISRQSIRSADCSIPTVTPWVNFFAWGSFKKAILRHISNLTRQYTWPLLGSYICSGEKIPFMYVRNGGREIQFPANGVFVTELMMVLIENLVTNTYFKTWGLNASAFGFV